MEIPSGILTRVANRFFGSANTRFIRNLQPKINAINDLEPRYQMMTDTELREQTWKFRQRLAAGETLDDLLVEAFAVCREAGRRVSGIRHYDVHLIAGLVLHDGHVAEMAPGDGKTLVATLPAYLNALNARGVHVVTTNDGRIHRAMEQMESLGLTVGVIHGNMEPAERQNAYACDITYALHSEFCFDYLRDNMRLAARGDDRWPMHLQQTQRLLHYAIIDEVDNVLIDNARSPNIITGQGHDDNAPYVSADHVVRQLTRDVDFEVSTSSIQLTDEGVRKVEQLAHKKGFHTTDNAQLPQLIDNALKAHHLYHRNVHYVIRDGEVVLIDEVTGRLTLGRSLSGGLHQAIEAKECVPIKAKKDDLASINTGDFFRLYEKIAGMTSTAASASAEFAEFYGLRVISVPANRQSIRIRHPDRIYRTNHERDDAVLSEIDRAHSWDVLVNNKGVEYWGRVVEEDEKTFRFREAWLPSSLQRFGETNPRRLAVVLPVVIGNHI